MSTSDALDGATLRDALSTSARWVALHADAVNALNVFPVPDGDTGLNMTLTLQAAAESAAAVETATLPAIATAMARGALMGARGNSGVILAQILRGMAKTLSASPQADGQTVAAALAAGSQAAYQSLANPVEGTILTVARAAAQGASRAALQSVEAVLEAAHHSAKLAVAETPELLLVLKQASVVDAGGEGYRIFLEGLLFHVRGQALPELPVAVTTWADLAAIHQDDGDQFGYCSEVLVQGSSLEIEEIKERVNAMGRSVLVVGDRDLVKVHVHTERPGALLDLATEIGELVKVKIDNMHLQHEEFARAASAPPATRLGPAVVAVASGAGLQQLFTSLGAVVVDGGPTMNPSVQQLTQAIEASAADQVLLLPNHKNVLLTAQSAARSSDGRPVIVIPTRNIPQGIAALLAMNPEADAQANAEPCTTAATAIHCVEITQAARDATLDGFAVKRGQYLVFLDDEPAGAADTCDGAVLSVVDCLAVSQAEMLTIYVGASGTRSEAEGLARILSNGASPAVEIVDGDQPHPTYIISME